MRFKHAQKNLCSRLCNGRPGPFAGKPEGGVRFSGGTQSGAELRANSKGQRVRPLRFAVGRGGAGEAAALDLARFSLGRRLGQRLGRRRLAQRRFAWGLRRIRWRRLWLGMATRGRPRLSRPLSGLSLWGLLPRLWWLFRWRLQLRRLVRLKIPGGECSPPGAHVDLAI